jgi:DNA replication protein DnaD
MKKEMLNEIRRSEADANIAREALMTHLQELLLLFSHLAEEYHIARTPSYHKLYQRCIKKYIKQETDATLPILPYKLLFHRLEENTKLIHKEISKISAVQGDAHDFTTLGK